MDSNEKETLLQKIAEANAKRQAAEYELSVAKRKLAEYEEKTDKAEKASRMKSLFLANMSHEIRTPLNAIEGFARIMAETDSADERMKYMEIVESNNARLLALIDEILDLSRVEAGELSIKKSMTDLNEMCRSMQNIFKFRCPDSVSDTGTGIAPEDQKHIFEAYVSRDAEQQNGYGLGLALCKIIVEKLGGHITVNSKLGAGSTFRFILPFQGTIGGMKKDARVTTNSRTIRVSTKTDLTTAPLILVAEDEDSNYELVRIVLAKRYRLLRAHNGIEAVTYSEEEHPALVLMDVRMPDMSGLDATRIIKEVNPDIPVVALSAYAFDENIREARDAGCDEFMAKPFRVEDLLDTVQRYVNQ